MNTTSCTVDTSIKQKYFNRYIAAKAHKTSTYALLSFNRLNTKMFTGTI